MEKIPEEKINRIKKIEELVNKIFLILIITAAFFLGRYSVPIEKEIDFGIISVEDKQTPIIQELIDKISKYDDLDIDNDLSRLKKD